jgi:hypothetical protein
MFVGFYMNGRLGVAILLFSLQALFCPHSIPGLRRLRLRRMKFVREQFYLAATVQNMKRLVRFLSPKSTEPVMATV